MCHRGPEASAGQLLPEVKPLERTRAPALHALPVLRQHDARGNPVSTEPPYEAVWCPREECFRALVEQSVDALLLLSAHGTVRYVSPAHCHLFGYGWEEVVGHHAFASIHPDDLSIARRQLAQLLQQPDTPVAVQFRVRHTDGSWRWVESVGRNLLADPRVDALVATYRDITERQQAEAALQESEQRFQAFMDNSPALAFIKDAAGRYVYLNKPAEQRFPTKLAAWQGKTDFDLWPAETAQQLRANDLAVLAKIQAIERIETVPQDDGPHQWLSFKFPLHDSLGRQLVGGMTLDITERKRAEAALSRLQLENLYLQDELKAAYNFEEIVGTSPAIKKVCRAVAQVAGTDATVLITGETGTGKELIARALHNLSRRKAKPLIKVNCTALPTGLIESELFGHEKGAFTGAVTRKIGRFELADGGTIFLDEIGDIPPEVQLKLLRVLQEQEFERVGGTQTLKVNVRVIAATNRDLRQAVQANAFRADLYYRLNVFPLLVPPLRERSEDLGLLAHYFVHQYAAKLGKRIPELSQEAMTRLAAYSWPGNIRELEHLIERAVILSRGPILEITDEVLPTEVGLEEKEERLRTLEEVEREYIVQTLETTRGVIEGTQGAATILKLHPNTLRGRMRRLGITRNHDIR